MPRRDILKTKKPGFLKDSRSLLNASYRSLLRSFILSLPSSQPNPTLLAILESPRVRFVNLSYLDDASGTSLLHEAAKRKDLRLIELAVRAGADVFVRDRKGRMAYDGTGKDDKVRAFLRQCKSFISRGFPYLINLQSRIRTQLSSMNRYPNLLPSRAI
jgi:oxysterol-binding protein 1